MCDHHLLGTLTRHKSVIFTYISESRGVTAYPNTHMLKLVNNASLCLSDFCLFSVLTILAHLVILPAKGSHKLTLFSWIRLL